MSTHPNTSFPIDQVLGAFAQGDVPTLLSHIADDVDFRIDHYRDQADTSWQNAQDKSALLVVLQRLAQEVFPRGTQILHTHSQPLGNDWVLTQFHQRFFYAVQAREVESLTWIVSHSQNGQMDYFRESVTTITPI
ncbi:MAG: hypothetical protein Q8R67_14995 [Rhodoferax sp.]|nr:hypothetical protein [Rhodoferax sp.]MDP3652983.1 hypothetical protein [Rhodoferax sp.]